MATKATPTDRKIIKSGDTAESGYTKWKRDKVKRGLEQAKDRDAMIPADRVWRNLGLER